MAILTGLAYQPIAYGLPSGDGPQAKVVNTGILNWAVNTIYVLDPTQNNQIREMQNIQSVFVDNALSTGVTTIQVGSTGHIIRVPPKTQGNFPLLAFDWPVLTISNISSNGTTQIWLTNFPSLGGTWTLP
jgi:hypothetical protein